MVMSNGAQCTEQSWQLFCSSIKTMFERTSPKVRFEQIDLTLGASLCTFKPRVVVH